MFKPKTLAEPLDSVNEAHFYGRTLPKAQREQTAKWIASRQGLPGSYANMFAPTEKDLEEGIRLFTGEKVRSGAAARHILGEEACRALILLNTKTAGVQRALARASEGIMKRIEHADTKGRTLGTYCCGTCTLSYWRHLTVGGLKNTERELRTGVKYLRSHRDGTGRWKRFPFYYTLLALNEMDLQEATMEMRYASPMCEGYLERSQKPGKFVERRRHLSERVLEKCW